MTFADFYAPIVRSVIAPLWAAKDRSPYLGMLTDLERTQYRTAGEIQALQLEKLQGLATDAFHHVPYYRQCLERAGYRPGDRFTFAEYAKFPILTKRDIQDHLDDLRSREFRREELVSNLTGGSTGQPLKFYHDARRMESRKAATWRHNGWAGYHIGDKAAFLWGMPRDFLGVKQLKSRLRNRLLERTIVMDTSSTSVEEMRRFHVRLLRFRPRIILGYANSLYLFARFLEHDRLRPPHVAGVISSAEFLFPEFRETIERVFAAPVFNRYGCREVSVIASECAEHQGLHINAENLYVEIQPPAGTADSTAPGAIIITDLENRGMPFLRYRIEDMGRLIPGDCPCGRGLPRLELAGGRVTEFLVAPSGKLISGAALTVLLVAKTPGVRQAQLVQEQRDHLRVRIVRDSTVPFEEDSMRRRIWEFFGERIDVHFEFTDHIPLTASGKYLFSISRVTPEFLRPNDAPTV